MPGGRVKLDPSRGSSLTMILAAPPERSGGVGGWAASERSRRSSAKWFKSIPDDTMSLECIIDIDAIGGPAVERRIRVLRDMGIVGGPDGEPPTIKVEGDIWDSDQNVTWVMSGLSFGDRLYNGDGSLRRQHVKVDLERYVEVDPIKPLRIQSTRSGGKRKRRQVQARGTDTLRAIALRELGDATRWKDLQRWNPKTLKGVDPDARLRTGIRLTVR
jgi:hypothetical protein